MNRRCKHGTAIYLQIFPFRFFCNVLCVDPKLHRVDETECWNLYGGLRSLSNLYTTFFREGSVSLLNTPHRISSKLSTETQCAIFVDSATESLLHPKTDEFMYIAHTHRVDRIWVYTCGFIVDEQSYINVSIKCVCSKTQVNSVFLPFRNDNHGDERRMFLWSFVWHARFWLHILRRAENWIRNFSDAAGDGVICNGIGYSQMEHNISIYMNGVVCSLNSSDSCIYAEWHCFEDKLKMQATYVLILLQLFRLYYSLIVNQSTSFEI